MLSRKVSNELLIIIVHTKFRQNLTETFQQFVLFGKIEKSDDTSNMFDAESAVLGSDCSASNLGNVAQDIIMQSRHF